MGNRHRHPAPERMKHPVSLVGRVQVVVKEPGDGLPLLRLGVITRGAHGRVSADEVVETELAGWGPGQQVMIEQGGEGLLGLGEGAAAQGRRSVQADRQRTGSRPAAGRTAGDRVPARGRTGRRQTSLRGCAAPGPPSWADGCDSSSIRSARLGGRPCASLPGGELDGERQAPAQTRRPGDLFLVLGPARSRDPPEQRDRVVNGQQSRVSVPAPSRSGSLRRVVIRIRHRPAVGSSGRIWSSRAASSRITMARRRLSWARHSAARSPIVSGICVAGTTSIRSRRCSASAGSSEGLPGSWP